MKKELKDFDLVKVLEDTSKKAEYDAVSAAGKAEVVKDIVKFIKDNNLKIMKEEEVTEEAEASK